MRKKQIIILPLTDLRTISYLVRSAYARTEEVEEPELCTENLARIVEKINEIIGWIGRKP